MTRYIDYETRNLPMMACKSGLELLERDELDTVRYLARADYGALIWHCAMR